MAQIQQDDRASLRSQETVKEKRKGKEAKVIELQSLKVEQVDPKELKPNAYNPNRQEEREFEMLRQSIRSDGFTMPVLVNKDLTIIDGEHRWRAALAEELKTIPIVRLDLDDARMKLSTIRHNKATGSHDAGLEALVLADLERLAGAEFINRELMIDEDALHEILNFTNAPDMLAGDEFQPSWSPVKNDKAFDSNDKGEPEVSSTFRVRKTVDSALVMRSPTSEANQLAYEKVVNKSAEAGKKSLYTLTAILSPEEAQLVQTVLEDPKIMGTTPAERLYSLAINSQAVDEEIQYDRE